MADTITLTGRLADITARPIDLVTKVTVKAPAPRPNAEAGVITTHPAPVRVDAEGRFTLSVVPGLGWLYLDGDGWSDTVPFVAAVGMTTVWEAVVNAADKSGSVKMILDALAGAGENVDAALQRALGELQGEALRQNLTWRRGNLDGSENIDEMKYQKDNGIWGVTTTAIAQELGMPDPGPGILTCICIMGSPPRSYAIQYWQSGTKSERWVRYNNGLSSSEWREWQSIRTEIDELKVKPLPPGTDLSQKTAPGVWNVRGDQITSMKGLPDGAKSGVLWAYSTLNNTHSMVGMYLDLSGRIWVRGFTPQVLPGPWQEVTDTEGSGGGTGVLADNRREALKASRGGVIGTAGKGAVALRFDHNVPEFEKTILPLLVERGIPCSQNHYTSQLADSDYGADWSNLTRNFHRGVEVWSHSQTHKNATTEAEIRREIAGSREEFDKNLPNIQVSGWAQPGIGATQYDDAQVGYSNPERWGESLAGQLIDAYYPASDRGGEMLSPLGARHQGLLSIDAVTSAAGPKSVIDDAARYSMAAVIMVHPDMVGKQGGISVSTYIEVLDYMVRMRDEGKIEILTMAGLSVADPALSYRFNLLPTLSDSRWSGWDLNGRARVGSDGQTLTTNVGFSRLAPSMGGVVYELAATLSGAGSVTVAVTDQETGLNRTMSTTIKGDQTVHLPVGIPRNAKRIEVTVLVDSGNVTVHNVELRPV